MRRASPAPDETRTADLEDREARGRWSRAIGAEPITSTHAATAPTPRLISTQTASVPPLRGPVGLQVRSSAHQRSACKSSTPCGRISRRYRGPDDVHSDRTWAGALDQGGFLDLVHRAPVDSASSMMRLEGHLVVDGDVGLLGEVRLVANSAMSATSTCRLIGRRGVDLVATDVRGCNSAIPVIHHDEYDGVRGGVPAQAAAWLKAHAEPSAEVSTTWGLGSDDVSVFHDLTDAEEQDLLDRLMAWQRRSSTPATARSRGRSSTVVRADAGPPRRLPPRGGGGLRRAVGPRDLQRHHPAGGPDGRPVRDRRAAGALIRPFLRTETLCCQLFSEPGAGSDLPASAPRRCATATSG